jgi:outer membrane protein OmpA-like peptidoglycan-associated protein
VSFVDKPRDLQCDIHSMRIQNFLILTATLSLMLMSCAHKELAKKDSAISNIPVAVQDPKLPTTLPLKTSIEKPSSSMRLILVKDMQIAYGAKQSDLKEQDKEELKKLVFILNKNSKLFQHVEIIGHADKEGNEDFVLDISKKRALTVSEVLKMAGLSSSQIQTSWRGDTEPATLDASQNRRAELKFYGIEKGPEFDKFIEELNKL